MTLGPDVAVGKVQTAGAAFLDALAAAGVTTVFGNPGTTELPLINDLSMDARIRYVLSLHEGTAVSAAAGHALMDGRPGVALLHAMPGVANGLSQYYNTFRSGVPLVVVAGTQDRRQQYRNPVLHADLVDVMRSVSKSVWEVKSSTELAPVISQALRAAASPPRGPVFLAVPIDVWGELVAADEPRLEAVPPRLGGAPVAAVDELAALMLESEKPICLAGDLVGSQNCGEVVAAIAELVGARLYWAPASSRANVPTTSRCYRGPVFPNAASFERTFAAVDLVIGFGSEVLPTIVFETATPIPRGVRMAAVMETPGDELGLLDPELSVCGDMRQTLDALHETLRRRLEDDPDLAGRVGERRDNVVAEGETAHNRLRTGSLAAPETPAPLSPRAAIAALLSAQPRDALVVEEAISNSGWVSLLGDFEDPLSYSTLARGGALGYSLGVAIGANLATGRPVLAIVGDGALMYGPQGLWTIARERLPIVTCVVNNGGYGILRQFLGAPFFAPAEGAGASADASGRILDIPPESLDFVGLARSLGVEAVRVSSAGECHDAVVEAFASGRPWLIDVPVTRG